MNSVTMLSHLAVPPIGNLPLPPFPYDDRWKRRCSTHGGCYNRYGRAGDKRPRCRNDLDRDDNDVYCARTICSGRYTDGCGSYSSTRTRIGKPCQPRTVRICAILLSKQNETQRRQNCSSFLTTKSILSLSLSPYPTDNFYSILSLSLSLSGFYGYLAHQPSLSVPTAIIVDRLGRPKCAAL